MRKSGAGKKSASAKPPLSPALMKELSSVVDHSDDDQEKSPDAGLSTGSSARGGLPNMASPGTPIMVMGENQVAAFTSTILAPQWPSAGSWCHRLHAHSGGRFSVRR